MDLDLCRLAKLIGVVNMYNIPMLKYIEIAFKVFCNLKKKKWGNGGGGTERNGQGG